MKSKDITLVIVVGIVSAVFALVISNFTFGSAKNRNDKVEIVEPISADFKVPASDDKYFNEKSVNPTQNIIIGTSTNDQPFSQSQ